MKNIVIVGAGQIGSRHLQALAKSILSLKIYVVDPSNQSLASAKFRFNEIRKGCASTEAFFTNDLSAIPYEIELGIIATSSTNRLLAIQDLLEKTNTKYLILEKVLFQTIFEYHQAESLFADKKTKVWVNCPRRMYHGYQYVKKLFTEDPPLSATMVGGEWGLACNAVHYLDIISFLTNHKHFEIDINYLQGVQESVRLGYKEVVGTLIARHSKDTIVSLTSIHQCTRPPIFKIVSNSVSVVICETQGECYVSERIQDWKWEKKVFNVSYQSDLTHIVLQNLVESDTCYLTDYGDSMKFHIPLINALTAYFQKHNIGNCPIT